jgi:uncharacterized protein (TIGR00369 family)
MEISKALGRKIPFATHLGIQLVENGNGRTVLMLDVRPELMNRFDVAHGGVVMTLLDVAMAIATHSLDPQADGVITVEMKTSFIGAATGTVTVEGRCLHLGKSVAFCEGRAMNADGRLAATASGTFMVRHKAGRRASAGEPRADE